MQPVIFPYVDKLVALRARLACFVSVVAVRARLGASFEDCLLGVREYVVELDSQVVVRDDNI